jgi:hypothetical protein
MPPVIDMSLLRARAGFEQFPEPEVTAAPDPYAGKPLDQLVLSVMPERMRVARAKAIGGDVEGAKADITFINNFTEANIDEISRFSGFSGSHPLGKQLAKEAMGLITKDYQDEISTIMQAPETRMRVISKKVNDLGGGEDMKAALAAAEGGDPSAIAQVASYRRLEANRTSRQETDPLSGIEGDYQTPGSMRQERVSPSGGASRRAPGAEVPMTIGSEHNPVDLFSYSKRSAPILFANLTPEVSGILGPNGVTELQETLFSLGDRGQEGRLASIVNREATRAAMATGSTPQNIARTMTATAKVLRDALKLASPKDGNPDPLRTQTSVLMLESIQDSLPGNAFISQGRQVGQVLAKAHLDMEGFAEGGQPFSDETAATYASTIFKKTYRPSDPLNPEEARLSDVMSQVAYLKGNVSVPAPLVTAPHTAGAPQNEASVIAARDVDTTGYSHFAGSSRRALEVAGAAVMRKGRGGSLADEMRNQIPTLMQDFIQTGSDELSARNAAEILSGLLVSGTPINFAQLPKLLKMNPSVNRLYQVAVTKEVATASPDSPVLRDVVGKVQGLATQDAYKALKEKSMTPDPVTGQPRSAVAEAALRDAAQKQAVSSDRATFAKNIMDVDARVFPDLAVGASDHNLIMDKVEGGIKKVLPQVSGVKSRAFEYLFNQVNTKALGSTATLDAVKKLILDDYAKVLPEAYAGSDKAALDEYADGKAKLLVGNVQEAVSKVGTPNAQMTASQTLGNLDDNQQARLTMRQVAVAPAILGTGASSFPGAVTDFTDTSTTDAVDLTKAFTKDLNLDPNKRGSAIAVKAKLVRLVSMAGNSETPEPASQDVPAAQAAAQAATRAAGPEFKIDLTRITDGSDGVKRGYQAIQKASEFFGKPIENLEMREFINQQLPSLLTRSGASSSAWLSFKNLAHGMYNAGWHIDQITDFFARNASGGLPAMEAAVRQAKLDAYEAQKKIAQKYGKTAGMNSLGVTTPTTPQGDEVVDPNSVE